MNRSVGGGLVVLHSEFGGGGASDMKDVVEVEVYLLSRDWYRGPPPGGVIEAPG